MNDPSRHHTGRNLLFSAVVFETSLALVALAGAWMASISVTHRLRLAPMHIFWASVETIPLLLALTFLVYSRRKTARDLVQTARDALGELFLGIQVPGIVLLSLAAGVGEEALFRGFLQPFLAGYIGIGASIVITGIIFGAAHWISTPYAVIAAAVGMYLGLLAEIHDTIIVPIAVHSLYDMVAIWLLIRFNGKTKIDLPDQDSGDTFSPS